MTIGLELKKQRRLDSGSFKPSQDPFEGYMAIARKQLMLSAIADMRRCHEVLS